jgi:hypothetical protein
MLVVLERLDPGGDIGGVAIRLVRDAALSGEEDAGQLGAQLL